MTFYSCSHIDKGILTLAYVYNLERSLGVDSVLNELEQIVQQHTTDYSTLFQCSKARY